MFLYSYNNKKSFFRERQHRNSKKLAKKTKIKYEKIRIKQKRFQKRKIKINQNVKIFGINCAGIKSKLKSFDAILKELKPTIWMLQETKLRPNEHIACASLDDYQVYYLSRQKSQGGGVALGVNKNIESTLINEGEEGIEILSVKLQMGGKQVRIVTAYGPQENASIDKKNNFWEFLEKEMNDAEFEEEGLILQMDGNLHAGPNLIKHDPNKQNQNGKIFLEFLERNPQLTVVNTLNVCEGLITRSRKVEEKNEKAVLDF